MLSRLCVVVNPALLWAHLRSRWRLASLTSTRILFTRGSWQDGYTVCVLNICLYTLDGGWSKPSCLFNPVWRLESACAVCLCAVRFVSVRLLLTRRRHYARPPS